MTPSNFESLLKTINDSPSMFATELLDPALGLATTLSKKGRFIDAFFAPGEDGLFVRIINTNYAKSYVHSKIKTDLTANGITVSEIEWSGLASGDTITVLSDTPAPQQRSFNATTEYFALNGSAIRCRAQLIGQPFTGELKGAAFTASCDTVGVPSDYAKYTLL
jgi:hypothetical protein